MRGYKLQEMLVETMTPDELVALGRLKKKKCPSCGAALTEFCACEIILPPGWFALGVYQRHLSGEMPSIIPPLTNVEFADLAFYSSCPDCGNISHWKFSKADYEAILNNKFQRLGYVFLDYHQKDWIVSAYSKCRIHDLVDKMTCIATLAEERHK